VIWAVVLLACVAITAGVYALWFRGDDNSQRAPVFIAQRGPMTIDIVESGTIKNRDPVIVKSQVWGQAKILWLIDEGVDVAEGDLLVQLDASGFEDAKISNEIAVHNAKAGLVKAEEDLALTESQGQSDVSVAELNYKLARLDLKKYVKGDYPEQIQKAEADITIAREELERAVDKLEWSTRLEGEGYITQTELQADELALQKSQLDLQLAERRLAVLKEYTHERQLAELESDVEQTEKALERTRRAAVRNNRQAQATLEAKQADHERNELRLKKVMDQITNCEIRAPVGGMVVYSTTGSGRWRHMSEPLSEGQEVREGQELIYLPTTSSMMAEVNIPEASIRKVKPGMPVQVTVDALPDRIFSARVAEIDLLPDARSAWLNPDLKEYRTDIHLEGDGEGLRIGMNCKARIVVERYDAAIYVPVQSVVRVNGQPMVYVQSGDDVVARPVEIGLDNNRMVHIISGLREGEKVLLAPPLAESSTGPDRPEGAGRPDRRRQGEPTTKPAGATTAEPTTPPADTKP